MQNLRRNFERFCYRNSNKGIPNLMLWVLGGQLIVYLFSMIDPSNLVYSILRFQKSAILQGQVWRLVSYIFIPESTYMLSFVIMAFFYFQISRSIEATWGTCKFNLFYLTGIILADIAAFVLPGAHATNYYLHMSLILAFATLYSETRILLFFIPLKVKYLAWFYFAVTAFEIVSGPMPASLMPLFALLNYFLFFGADIRNVFSTNPVHTTFHMPHRKAKPKKVHPGEPHPHWADGYQSANGQRPYHHKCTVCGRTDTEYPDLEFRYCSRCNGYYCYCMDHINNHTHIE